MSCVMSICQAPTGIGSNAITLHFEALRARLDGSRSSRFKFKVRTGTTEIGMWLGHTSTGTICIKDNSEVSDAKLNFS